jgi:hypothetical protein
MKRDMDLIRSILLQIESTDDVPACNLEGRQSTNWERARIS